MERKDGEEEREKSPKGAKREKKLRRREGSGETLTEALVTAKVVS